METFLDFLTENYIYFLIVAGVLTLALIGLLVSSKKKNKAEDERLVKYVEPVNIEQSIPTSTQSNSAVAPTIESSAPLEYVNSANQPYANASNVTPMEPAYQNPQVEETLNFNNAQPVAPASTVEPIHETPATIDTNYDEPIMQIDQNPNNNFHIDQDNNR